jgi:predicted ATPase/DNA-binding CsgD family transcriptional regulator
MSAATQLAPGLPEPPTALIGREREIVAVARRVRRADVRLLTLVGPPGIGKTRLALAVAARLRATPAPGGGLVFPDGVWFVPLEALGDPELVVPTIGRALGVVERGDPPLPERLRLHMHRRRALLVLDNFEQVLPAAPEVAALLAAAPALKVLVTSRAALRLAAEHRFPVPPLALPPAFPGGGPAPERTQGASGPGPGLDGLARSEAERLFVARARAVQPDFGLTAETAPAVAELCRRLDGLPLAIELAAARVSLLPPPSLLGRLEHRLGLLAGGARDLPVRHQSLRGAIAWSYDLLTPGERALFRSLAVFAGGFTLEAAEAVCPPAGGDAPTTAQTPPGDAPPAGLEQLASPSAIERLASLVEKSLVRPEAPAGGAPRPAPRFGLLETVREYAAERLAAGGEEAAARRRHAHYYLALAETAEGGPGPDRLEIEHDNLRQALAWCQTGPATAADGGALGLRLAAALGPFWRRRGHWSEGRRWLAAALALPPGTGPTLARARALQDAGTLAAWQGEFAAGRALLEASVAAWRTLGDRRGLAGALGELTWPRQNDSAFAAARSGAEECVALWRDLGDRAGLARALRWLGHAVGTRPDASPAERREAEALWEESLALFRELGDDAGASEPLFMLGWLARVRGDYATTRSLMEQTVALRRMAPPGGALAMALLHLGAAALLEGDLASAGAHFEEALTLFRAAGNGLGEAETLAVLGDLARRGGDTARAAAGYAEALDLARRVGGTAVVARSLAGQADLARRAGALARARGLYGEGLAALRRPTNRRPDALGTASALVRCLIGLAGIEAAQGRPARAARLLGAATTPMAAVGRQLEPPDAADHAAGVGEVRATLSEADFAAAFGAGRAMSPSHALADALHVAGTAAPGPPGAGTTGPRHAPGGPPPVTPREAEVARLVAAGRTNREIADALHVTERTVENHVAHILTKLGFRSRVEIATWVVGRGRGAAEPAVAGPTAGRPPGAS